MALEIPVPADVIVSRPQELTAKIRAEMERWRKVVKEAKLTVN